MLARTDDRKGLGELQRARCVWCGAAAEPVGGRLAVCSTCGAASTYPAPTDQELDSSYSTWYRPASGRFSAGGDRLLEFSRARLARRLNRIAPAGPLLDVGAGDGALLRALQVCGRPAVGLERTSGDGVIACELVDFDEREGEWAGVVFWHSLEHLRDAAGALDRAAALLAPGGVLVIAAPNLASWQSRLFGDSWFHLDLPRHLVHLPASTLVAGVERRGLKIERLSHWRGGQLAFGWLHGMVAKLPGQPDLYSAIRQPEARVSAITGPRRTCVLQAAVALSPLAALLATVEVTARAGGTIYLEARRP